MSQIRLFIVEDQPKILKNQVKLLEGFNEIEILDTAMSGEEAIKRLQSLATLPDVILCDIGLPGISGTEVTKWVKANCPKIEVLMFTVFDEEDQVLQAVRAGASGYLLKGAPANKIVEAIVEVNQGGTVIQPSLARKLLRHFRMPLEGKPPAAVLAPERNHFDELDGEKKRSLTERELECLQMIAKGLSNNEAAEVLGLSKATIRTHLEHIYQKLDVTNRVEAVTEGIRQGIIEI
jgi:DNA-binding NarL/FixJ family response regulator